MALLRGRNGFVKHITKLANILLFMGSRLHLQCRFRVVEVGADSGIQDEVLITWVQWCS